MLQSAVLGTACVLIFVTVHALTLFFGNFKRQAVPMTVVILIVSLVYTALFIVLRIAEAQDNRAYFTVVFLNGLIYYLAGVGIYIGTVFYAVLRSVCLRLLIEVKRSGPGGLSHGELKCVYPVDGMVRERLETMVETGWLRQTKTGRYELTTRGRSWARFFLFVRERLQIGPGVLSYKDSHVPFKKN